MDNTEEDPTLLVSDMLKQLSIATEEERKTLLEQARPHLFAPDASSKFKRHLESDNLAVIFDCLNAKDESTIIATCEILARVFEFVDTSVIMMKYPSFLQKGLDHKSSQVKEVMLLAMRKCLLSSEETRCHLLNNKGLLVGGAMALIDKELSVSKEASLILMKLAELRNGDNQIFLFVPPVLPCLHEMLEVKAEDLKLRVLDLLVQVSNLSQEHLEMVSKQGFLRDLFEDLKKDEDLLVQLNAIEIVSDLAESKRGFQYLTNMNVLTQMDARLNDISSGSYASFLMPGYIKFFGHMAFHSPTNFHEMYPSFSAILMNMLTSDITESQILALEVISHIAVKWKGKEMLQSRNEVQEKVYEVLRKQIKSGPSDLRVRALGAFANIIKNVDESGEVPDIARDLFDKLEPPNNTMPAIIGLAKQPFADISAAAYDILVSASYYAWGVQKFLDVPGFMEYLLDRSTAKDKEAKVLKYNLISSIVAQSEVGNIVPPEILKQLRFYVNQGAFYVEATARVALDEQ